MLQDREPAVGADRHRDDGNAVHSDRVGSILRTRAEHSAQRLRAVVPWMDSQDGPVGPVQPREQNQLVAHPDVAQCVLDPWIEYEEGQGRSFLALFRCLIPASQW